MSGDGWGAEGINCPAKCGRAASGTPLGLALSWDSPIPPLGVVMELEHRMFLTVRLDGETFIVDAELGMRYLGLGGARTANRRLTASLYMENSGGVPDL